MIEVRQVADAGEKRRFLGFPWRLYRGDPLWVPPIYSTREKATDPKRGLFFRKGYADFFVVYRGDLVGTLCCSHEQGADPGECSLGFFECIQDVEVAAALFDAAETWARKHRLSQMRGTYNLDREDGRGRADRRTRPSLRSCCAGTIHPTTPASLSSTASQSIGTTAWPTPSLWMPVRRQCDVSIGWQPR